MTAESPNTNATRGRLLLVAAALLWSTSGLFLKSPPLTQLDVATRGPVLACYRVLFAALFLAPLVKPRAVRWRPALVPMVIAFAVMNLLFVTAMARTTAAAAIFLQYTCAVWAFVFGVLILRERADRGNVVALLVSVCGIALIVAADWHSSNSSGNVIALGSGFSYAVVILFLRYLRDENAAWLVVLNHAGAAVVLLPWVLWLAVPLNSLQWLLVALMGVLQMGLPYVLFAIGVRAVKAQEAALITLFEPVLNPCLVWLCYREAVAPGTMIGGGLILGGLALRYALFPTRTVDAPSAE